MHKQRLSVKELVTTIAAPSSLHETYDDLSPSLRMARRGARSARVDAIVEDIKYERKAD